VSYYHLDLKKYPKIILKITSFKKRLKLILTMKKIPFTKTFITMFIKSTYWCLGKKTMKKIFQVFSKA
jgi:hypothetical protein